MATPRTPLTLIVAATQTNGIGLAGGLPWRLPDEMKYFARVTTEGCGATADRPNAVVMGRKTWDGIPAKFRPLKNRRNLVVSRSAEVDVSSSPSTTLHASLPSALAAPAATSANHTFLIGGSQLYTLALQPSASGSSSDGAEPPLVDRILLTRVLSPAFEACDAHLPEFRADGRWARAPHAELCAFVGFPVADGEREEKGVRYRFELWVFDPAARA